MHKVDGLSEETKMETHRRIFQTVQDDLADQWDFYCDYINLLVLVTDAVPQFIPLEAHLYGVCKGTSAHGVPPTFIDDGKNGK